MFGGILTNNCSMTFVTVIECPSLSLANGLITYAGDGTPEFAIGSVASHSCDAGFTLDGFIARTCMDDDQADIIGVWSESPPSCERKDFEHKML